MLIILHYIQTHRLTTYKPYFISNNEYVLHAVKVCYFQITRSRNRWKFHLKDGIMNLNGEDFVFQKANGDAEW